MFDCLFFTESWLHVNFPDSLLDPAGKYTVIRKDRQSGSGGGVCALISKSLRCVALEQFSLSDVTNTNNYINVRSKADK